MVKTASASKAALWSYQTAPRRAVLLCGLLSTLVCLQL